MKVLVCGAYGFIGAAICAYLQQQGHQVLKGTRVARHDNEVAMDFMQDTDLKTWLPRLVGVDAVVNAVGIIIEQGAQRFDVIHNHVPHALFAACSQAGVRHVIQISAMGAETRLTPYFSSKCSADDFLLSLPVIASVLRPGLVYGVHGASARMFRTLASVPVHVLPGGGRQVFQPLHINELAEMVALRLESTQSACLELVGAQTVTYKQMLAQYRASMGWGKALVLSVPAGVMSVLAACLDYVPGALFTRDTWLMLQRSKVCKEAETVATLRRMPLGVSQFITPAEAPFLKQEALSGWRNPLLRLALAATWLGTAWVSAFVYPRADSLALLAPVHLTGTAALVALYGASVLDAVLGVLTLLRPRRGLWWLQVGLVLAYSLVICVLLPQFLAHPFGPVLKNLPILAILFLLASEESAS